jgi:hypothetical protein
MLALGQVVHADVDFAAARHPAGDLFAGEEIVVLTQLLGAFDRIVLGERDEVHAARFQRCADFVRVAVTFAAEFANERSGTQPGKVRVDMQVALHGIRLLSLSYGKMTTALTL